MKKGDCSQPQLATLQLATPFFLSPQDIVRKRIRKKIIEIDGKRLIKKMALIKTDYEKGRLQPTPAGHPQLATPRANYFLLVYKSFQNYFIFLILGLKFGTYLQLN
jgi:hypothetical protein